MTKSLAAVSALFALAISSAACSATLPAAHAPTLAAAAAAAPAAPAAATAEPSAAARMNDILCRAGNAAGCHNLALLIKPRDEARARKLLARACRAGHHKSCQ